jgi:hypothetical protein
MGAIPRGWRGAVFIGLALGAVAISVLLRPERYGFPHWTKILAICFLIAGSLVAYRSGCNRCQN